MNDEQYCDNGCGKLVAYIGAICEDCKIKMENIKHSEPSTGRRIKHRFKPSNITPSKKKRK
jgi:hypothetical protein